MGWFARNKISNPSSDNLVGDQAKMPVAKSTFEPTVEPIIEPTDKPVIESTPTLRQIQRELTEGTPTEVAQRHAQHLLDRLLDEWGPGEKIRYESVAAEYGEFCSTLGIQPRPWNQVGKHLALMTRKKGRPAKCYQGWLDHNGKKRQIRLYVLPQN